MLIGHLFVFFGEMFTQVLGSFFNPVVFVVVELLCAPLKFFLNSEQFKIELFAFLLSCKHYVYIWGGVAILTVLRLLIYEQRMCFHLVFRCFFSFCNVFCNFESLSSAVDLLLLSLDILLFLMLL